MKNADMPAMPQYEIHQDCGFDGSRGPDLVQTITSGLTKREHFAGLAMQGLLANDNDGGLSASHSAMYAVEYADALLAVLEE